jgi:hypothetical protein
MKMKPTAVGVYPSNVVPIKPAVMAGAASLERATRYPELRYMGSKKRLLPWIHQVLTNIDFETALDPFSGTGCVAYLMKSMGRRVVASDFLNFSSIIAKATVENNHRHLDGKAIRRLIDRTPGVHRFIGVFSITCRATFDCSRIPTSRLLHLPRCFAPALSASPEVCSRFQAIFRTTTTAAVIYACRSKSIFLSKLKCSTALFLTMAGRTRHRAPMFSSCRAASSISFIWIPLCAAIRR